MSRTTVGVFEETRDELMEIKDREGFSNVDVLINEMINEYEVKA
jgi:hypothetical protein